MVATFAVMLSTSYYTRQAAAVSYYVNDEATGIWLRGHEILGVSAGDLVKPEDFDRACAGLDVNGNMLVKSSAAGPRMLGVDVTCSSPKAVSIEFAFGSPKTRATIADCERQAIEAVAQLVEREIPLARRGHGGARKEHANFVAAVFTHCETRPETHQDGTVLPDPQRHHHLCFPNIAQREDGSWGGIDSVGLRSWRNAIGAIYRLELASALQRHGYQIERDDEGDWKWSLAGIPKELCAAFSARRAALEETLYQAGTTSSAAPALAAAINATDRKQKLDLSLDELTEKWRGAAKSFGFAPDAIGAHIEATDAQLNRDVADVEAGRSDHLAAIPNTLTEHSATFSRRELIAQTANALVGTRATLDDVIVGSDDLVAGNRVLERAETRDGPVYTTPEILSAEQALVELAKRNAEARVAGPDPKVRDRLLADVDLNAEQQEVVRTATSGARLALVQGGAGTGKSTTLGTISKAWQSAGYQVVGAAVAWRAANTLSADLGVEARAIDAWLKSVDKGNQPFREKTCLIVEEAGLQSTPQTLRLLEAVDRTGGIVIMVGDEHQLRPIGPGHAMRLIRETVGATRIETVVRQREAWARQAPADFARGKAREALDAFAERDLIQYRDGPRAAVEAIADHRQSILDEDPKRHVLVAAKTNAEVRALSAAIRSRMRERGALAGPDVAIDAADSSGNRHTLHLAAGDWIRFLRRDDELGVVNGTEARIVAVAQDRSGQVRIEAERDGQRIAFSPADLADSKGRARLAHAYAVTLFQAQGLTVDHSLVLMSPRFDRHDAYVAASRARERTEFFLDARTLDREIEPDRPLSSEEDRAEARMAYLAERLARQSVKTNALDYLPESQRTRDRQREFSHEL